MLRMLFVAAALLWQPPPTLALFYQADGILVRWGGPYGCVQVEGPEHFVKPLGCYEAGEGFVTYSEVRPGYVVRYYTGVETVEAVIMEPHFSRLPLVVHNATD